MDWLQALGLKSYIYMEDGIEKSFEEQESSDEEKEKEEGEVEGDKEEVRVKCVNWKKLRKDCSGSHSGPSSSPSQQQSSAAAQRGGVCSSCSPSSS